MQSIFVARGPNFRKNFTIKSFPNVELYQVMCSILDIPPSPNDGTWEFVQPMLRDLQRPKDLPVSYASLVLKVVGALIIVLLVSAIVCAYYCKQRTGYTILPKSDETENDVSGNFFYTIHVRIMSWLGLVLQRRDPCTVHSAESL